MNGVKIMDFVHNEKGFTNKEDEEKYLELRKEKLEYGLDYFNLAKFYYNKNDIDNAIIYANRGIKKGKGRIIDNIILLKDIYLNMNNYDETLKYWILSYKNHNSYETFKDILNYCKKEDEENINKQLLSITSSNFTLSQIYFEDGEYDKVLDIAKENKSYFETYKEMITEKYPEEMIKYYKKCVDSEIYRQKRTAYRCAAQYAENMKKIYLVNLKQYDAWNKYITQLLKKYPKHRALQDQFKEVARS